MWPSSGKLEGRLNYGGNAFVSKYLKCITLFSRGQVLERKEQQQHTETKNKKGKNKRMRKMLRQNKRLQDREKKLLKAIK